MQHRVIGRKKMKMNMTRYRICHFLHSKQWKTIDKIREWSWNKTKESQRNLILDWELNYIRDKQSEPPGYVQNPLWSFIPLERNCLVLGSCFWTLTRQQRGEQHTHHARDSHDEQPEHPTKVRPRFDRHFLRVYHQFVTHRYTTRNFSLVQLAFHCVSSPLPLLLTARSHSVVFSEWLFICFTPCIEYWRHRHLGDQ